MEVQQAADSFGGFYQSGKQQLLVPAHLQHPQVLAAALDLQGYCSQWVSDSFYFNMSQVNFGVM